jgi:MFS transporter, SP family, sugar:H+ symporter
LKTQVGLGSKVGFIFGAISLLSLVFTYFCVPECKGKTLEQVDWLFNNNVKLRHFGDTDASGMLDGNIFDNVKASTYKGNTSSYVKKV